MNFSKNVLLLIGYETDSTNYSLTRINLLTILNQLRFKIYSSIDDKTYVFVLPNNWITSVLISIVYILSPIILEIIPFSRNQFSLILKAL